jgi:hypothetical protein
MKDDIVPVVSVAVPVDVVQDYHVPWNVKCEARQVADFRTLRSQLYTNAI